MSKFSIPNRRGETDSLQILLIEDNPGDARIVKELLHEGGRSATLAWERDLESGLEVLTPATRSSLDVLIVDLNLPDSAGTHTVDRVTQEAPQLPVVVLTGQHDLDAALASLDGGATEYLRKEELTPSLLRRTLRWAIERRKREEQLEHTATHDSLTGLPNRLALHRELRLLVEESNDTETVDALLYLDLDRFKQVNDSLGHSKGDELLSRVADRLREAIRESDLVARLGGDEFAVCLSDAHTKETVYRVAERIFDKLGNSFSLDGQDVYAPASIGVVMGISRYDSVEDALRDADAAMYEAKEQVRKPFVVYEKSLNKEIDVELTLDADLRDAIEHDEFIPYFQPIVDHKDGCLKRVEVLARWEHPDRGILAPDAFLPTAETTGLIIPLGHQVVEKATQAIDSMKRGRGSEFVIPISANFSQQEFFHEEAYSILTRLFQDYEIAPTQFTIEVTERAVDRLSPAKMDGLMDLKKLGVSIVLDDFGTEFSSFQLLKSLPVDGIKLDKDLVSGITDDNKSRVLVESVVHMARKLGIDITAEGIETPAQLAVLRQIRCPSGQGSLFSRPVPHDQLGALIDTPAWAHYWNE